MSATVERNSLDLRFQSYRLRNKAAETRLLAVRGLRRRASPGSGLVFGVRGMQSEDRKPILAIRDHSMPRPPRVQFAGANYHIVTRGDGRRKLFHDTGHYERFTKGLEDEVQRSGWIVLAYCWMPNHIHALIQTPEPNLARGMQHWLSGYANWYAKRNRRIGHLYQGRYKAFLVTV